MASIKTIHDCISKDLNALEKSNLRQANFRKYTEFKEAYEELDKKATAKEQVDAVSNNTYLSLLSDWAKLSAKFDAYMSFLGGYEEIADYQVKEVTSHLQTLLNELNKDNYTVIDIKLKEYLRIIEDSSIKEQQSVEIKNLITKIKYEIYKYKVEFKNDLDTIKKENFITLIIDDINKILNDEEVTLSLKNALKKYLIDTKLIIEDFSEVINFIILGFYNKNISEEELNEELEERIYENLTIEYKKDLAIEEEVQGFFDKHNSKEITIISGLINYLEHSDKEHISEYFSRHCINLVGAVDKLIEYNFTDIKYLAECILLNDNQTYYDLPAYVYSLREDFRNRGKNYDKEFDKAVIACRNTIPVKELAKYAAKTHNLYLEKFVLNHSVEDLISIYLISLEECFEIPSKILQKIYKDGTKEDFIKLLNRRTYQGSTTKNSETVINIISHIPNDKVREEVLNELYENVCNNITIVDKLVSASLKSYKGIYDANHIQNLNVFEASYISRHKADQIIDILFFVRKFYNAHLDWKNLLKCKSMNLLKDEERTEFLVYMYEGTKEEFFNIMDNINSNTALEIVLKHPEAVNGFISYMYPEDILKLPSSTLDIFCTLYEEKLKQESISLNDKVNTLLSVHISQLSNEVKLLLTYIMHKGLLSDNILIYKENFSNIYAIAPLINKAIANTKPTLRVHFLEEYYGNDLKGVDETVLFLSDKEIQALESEDRFIEKRTYYGSLLKIFPSVSVISQKRIVMLIAKSNIEEFIIYIYMNYGEHQELLLANLNNADLYRRLVTSELKSDTLKK